MTEATRIDLSQGHFMANGNLYRIMIEDITLSRYEIYERYALEVGFGSTFEEIFETLKKIYDTTTTGESPLKALHEASLLAMNQLHGIKKYDEREPPSVLKFCTLFINKEGEDITKWSEHLAKEKINDWTKEGIAVQDFFLLASSAIRGFLDAFRVVESIKEAKSKRVSTPTT